MANSIVIVALALFASLAFACEDHKVAANTAKNAQGAKVDDESVPLVLPAPVPDMPSEQGGVKPGCRPENAVERSDRLSKQSARQAQTELEMPIGECPAGQVSTGVHFKAQ